MARIIRYLPYISRQFIRENRDCYFLFGDNLQHSGFGGQASEMRGEPNSIGIPTKKKPSMLRNSFFTDKEFEINKVAIDDAFKQLPDAVIVYVPTMGLGTGLSMLEHVAPLTFEYLKKKLEEL